MKVCRYWRVCKEYESGTNCYDQIECGRKEVYENDN